MITPAQAQTFLTENFAPWVLDLGITVDAVAPDETLLTVPIIPRLARHGGIVSGQALAALADTAMVLACGGFLGQMRPVATVTLDTQFLRPATGDQLRARAKVIKGGRSMMFAQCTIAAAPAGKDVAFASASFAI